MNGKLILKDGTTITGNLYGANFAVSGEVVFATGMTGYDLSLTDPSFAGQILVFTYPLIGNWGVPPQEVWESEKIHPRAIIVGDLTIKPSHWQSTQTLDSWCKKQGVPILSGVDTRALTQKLREHGVMLGKIVTENEGIEFEDPNKKNLVAEVSISKLRFHRPCGHPELVCGSKKILKQVQNDRNVVLKIGLLNCGAKRNIISCLVRRGAEVYEMPWDFDPFENNLELDGLMISNGPGDPKIADKSIAIIKKSMEKKLPTFGICLGNQLLALAAGGDTYKLKFGHRAQNQPTIQVGTNRCFITTQNHGYAVDEKKMPHGFQPWFVNANDGTNEGIIHKTLPFFSVQFHPEARPGPTDTEFLFDYFLERIRSNSHSGAKR